MKKNYITPESAEKFINPSQLICLSITEGDADPSLEVLTKKRDDNEDYVEESIW